MEYYQNEDFGGKGGLINKYQINEIIRQMGVNICLIHDINGDKATGFFCKIPYPNDFTLLPVLISNSEILNEQNTQLNNTIKLTFDDDKKSESYFVIDSSRKVLIDYSLGISVIEIKEKDVIDKFLDIDDNINNENYINIYKRRPNIYTLYFSNDEKSIYSGGLLKEISDQKIQYSFKPFFCSSGAPILLLSSFKLIGILSKTKGQNNKDYNEGIFIRVIIEEFKKNFPTNKNNAFILEDNKDNRVIIGQFFPKNSENKNNIKNP
jgi:hypothetical protein